MVNRYDIRKHIFSKFSFMTIFCKALFLEEQKVDLKNYILSLKSSPSSVENIARTSVFAGLIDDEADNITRQCGLESLKWNIRETRSNFSADAQSTRTDFEESPNVYTFTVDRIDRSRSKEVVAHNVIIQYNDLFAFAMLLAMCILNDFFTFLMALPMVCSMDKSIVFAIARHDVSRYWR